MPPRKKTTRRKTRDKSTSANTRAQRNIDWIEKTLRVPEGRLVGKPVVLYEPQREIIRGIYDTPTRTAIISFARKNGKGVSQALDILTENRGWIKVGDLVVGDRVYGTDGLPTRVTYVSPTHHLRCFRFTFSDGSEVVADEEHQWTTTHRYRPWANPRKNGSGNGGRRVTDTVSTLQVAESVNIPRPDGVREHNHSLPPQAAISGRHVGLPLDPYILGVWLGDGSAEAPLISKGAIDLEHFRREFESRGVGTRVVKHNDRCEAFRFDIGGWGGSVGLLRDLGVYGNKHIPSQYSFASIGQRRDLLRGLMDTDGTVSRNGGNYPYASYSSCSERLANDVWSLVRGLGYKATINNRPAKLNGRVTGTHYEVRFRAARGDGVFSLPRKNDLLSESVSTRGTAIKITACEEVTSVPTRCLQVDAPDSLFLVGRGFIPTHNTSLSAMLLLLHLAGPEHQYNSQLFSAAQSRDQAAVLFGLAARMVRMSPDLSAYVTIRDTAKQLVCRELGTEYRALSAEAPNTYGLSPVFVVHDELGQVKSETSELYDALETAQGAHENPLSIIISTQAPTDSALLSVLIDDAATNADPKNKLFLWTAPPDDDPYDPATWAKANPLMGTALVTERVAEVAEKARRMPSREAAFRNLNLNQRVDQTSPLIPQAVWKKCAGEPDLSVLQSSPVVAGLDLSKRTDITAFVFGARDDDDVWHVMAEFWAPEVGLADRVKKDRVPYDVWKRQGWLTTTPGAAIDYSFVAARIAELSKKYKFAAIAFDRWNIDALKNELDKIGADLPLVSHGQGFRDMSPAIDALETELIAGRVRHGGNPILTNHIANAKATMDPAGNRKLDKKRSTGRIDGSVAMSMMFRADTLQEAPKPRRVSIYEQGVI